MFDLLKGLYFDKEADSNGADDPETEPTEETPESVDDQQETDETTEEKKFSQKDVDEIVRKRLARDRIDRKKETKPEPKKEQKKESKKEEESDGEDYKSLADEAKQRAEDAEARLRQRDARDLFFDTASELKFDFASTQAGRDAFSFLDLESISFDEESGYDKEEMRVAIESLKDEKPYFFKGETETQEESGGTDAKRKTSIKTKKADNGTREKEIRSKYNIKPPR